MSIQRGSLLVLLLLSLISTPLQASLRNPPPSPGRIQAKSLIKIGYTFQEEDESTGVEGVSQAAVRWAGLSVEGMVSDNISFYFELVAGAGIYNDPVYEESADLAAGPAGMGNTGIRRAEISMDVDSSSADVPAATIRVGTFMPGWGLYQDMPASEWDFIDLPLIYRHDSFHALGWQNAGVAVDLYPLGWSGEPLADMDVTLTVFAINGYFPRSFANQQPELGQGERESSLGLGSRLAVSARGWLFYGGFYEEGFHEDRYGEKDPESYRCRAYIAGVRYGGEKLWTIAEWSALNRDDYQLKQNGDRADKQSVSAHLAGGWRFTKCAEALVRWDWMDPNTLNQSSTIEQSKNDQVTAWTMGVNWYVNPHIELLLNYVVLREQGKRVDVDAGRTGGAYRERDNNYFRAEMRVRL